MSQASTSTLDHSHLEAISIIERVNSVLSLLGSAFVIITFIVSDAFHKPINRLVFYASFGNMMSNVGTLMSRTFTDAPNSTGCQAQSFLIQWFMPADALWTLAMAINVYLTFYFKFDARRLRRMEIPYLLVCYGIPFVPALTFLFLENKNGVKVYGNASLWCWVSKDWGIWRVITFYAPVWCIVGATFFIYLRAGHTIYRKRKELGDFRSTVEDPAITTIKTTQVSVSMVKPADNIQLQPMDNANSRSNGTYEVYISAVTNPYAPNNEAMGTSTQIVANRPLQQNQALDERGAMRKRYRDINNAAWQYTRVAILFFTVMLLTWIPSSANRVYTLANSGRSSSLVLEYMSAFVLPLQGFWNSIIYIVTTWSAVKNLASDLKLGRRMDVKEFVVGMAPAMNHNHASQSHRHSQGAFRVGHRSRNVETESMKELAETPSES